VPTDGWLSARSVCVIDVLMPGSPVANISAELMH
jgi:hypothetical protein